MSEEATYLAIFLGSRDNPKMAAWGALPEAERLVRQQAGIAAWHAWGETHKEAIVVPGGPLGKTRKISDAGVEELEQACDKFEVSKQRYIERESQRTEKITARKILSTKGTLKMSGR